jgi:predicted Zn-dependent peptidase
MRKDSKKNIPYEKIVLPNKLTVFFIDFPIIKSFYAYLYVKTGAACEKPHQSGISHFLEHLIHEDDKQNGDKSLLEKIEEEGMYQNAATNLFGTYFYIASHHSKQETAINFIYQLVFGRELAENRLNHVKNIILHEIRDYNANPYKKFTRTFFEKRVKKKTIYHNPILGNEETVKQFTKEQVIAWKEKNYQPANIVLSFFGNINKEKILKIIASNFAQLKNTDQSIKLPKPKVEYSDYLIYHQQEKNEQIEFTLSFPAFGYKETSIKNFVSLWFLKYLLVGARSSRLYKKLKKEKSLIYYLIGGRSLFPYLGSFQIIGSVSKNNLALVISLIKKEIEKIKNNQINEAELTIAKNLYQRDIITFNFETPLQIYEWVVGQYITKNKIYLPDDFINISNKISVDDIHDVARKIFDFTKLNIGLYGNLKDEEIKRVDEIFIALINASLKKKERGSGI